MENQTVIATFYHFADLHDYEDMKNPLLRFCKKQELKGTILLAREGLNSTISGTRESINALMAHLKSDPRLSTLEHKESYDDTQPFSRMKVRLKKEVVAMGMYDLDLSKRGTYVEPEDWDALISDPDVVLVDTRNDYEYKLGTFEGAIDPKTNHFREFPQWVEENLDASKHKKVAMFCTGGIRCEKSTSLLKNKGFEEVYHLKGGILDYFAKTGNANKKWQGDCFIFDDRVAVNDKLEPSGAAICQTCYQPVTTDDIRADHAEAGTRCRACAA